MITVWRWSKGYSHATGHSASMIQTKQHCETTVQICHDEWLCKVMQSNFELLSSSFWSTLQSFLHSTSPDRMTCLHAPKPLPQHFAYNEKHQRMPHRRCRWMESPFSTRCAWNQSLGIVHWQWGSPNDSQPNRLQRNKQLTTGPLSGRIWHQTLTLSQLEWRSLVLKNHCCVVVDLYWSGLMLLMMMQKKMEWCGWRIHMSNFSPE